MMFEHYLRANKLLGIELNDKLFLHRHGQIIADRQVLDNAFHFVLLEIQPLGDASPDNSLYRITNRLHFLAFFPNTDNIADGKQIGGDIHLFSVDQKMIVPNKMSALTSRVSKPQAIDHIIQTSFQKYEQIGTRNPFLTICFNENQMKLLLGKAIHTLDLLLLSQLNAVVGNFPTATLSLFSRGITAPVKRTFI